MSIRNLLTIGALACTVQSNAQNWVADSVEMGVSYKNDIYYSLQNGLVDSANASNWHLGFQMTQFGNPWFNATVRANHIKGAVQVYPLHLGAANFSTLSASDTIGKTSPSMQLINIDTSWGEGAFTQNRNLSMPFDFGWGKYQGPPTHSVIGDSLYLVKVNNVPYKILIQEYVSLVDTLIGFKFRIAQFDGTGDTMIYIKRKPDYTNRLFAYYNITTRTVLNREPAKTSWDMLFTQYPKYLVFGPVPGVLQSYTGVLTNDSIMVAEINNVDPDTMAASGYYNYLPALTSRINEIGDDWKTFNMTTFTYDLDTLKSWIIKSNNSGAYYQLKFTRFDGASGGATGKIVFATRFIANATTVKETINNIYAYGISPNPAADNVKLVVEAREKAENAGISITDLTGKVVYNSAVKINSGLNAFNIQTNRLANGTYIVSLTNGSWKVAEKLVVQH